MTELWDLHGFCIWFRFNQCTWIANFKVLRCVCVVARNTCQHLRHSVGLSKCQGVHSCWYNWLERFYFTVTWSKTSDSNTLWSQTSNGQVKFSFYHGHNKINPHTYTHRLLVGNWLQLIFFFFLHLWKSSPAQNVKLELWHRVQHRSKVIMSWESAGLKERHKY